MNVRTSAMWPSWRRCERQRRLALATQRVPVFVWSGHSRLALLATVCPLSLKRFDMIFNFIQSHISFFSACFHFWCWIAANHNPTLWERARKPVLPKISHTFHEIFASCAFSVTRFPHAFCMHSVSSLQYVDSIITISPEHNLHIYLLYVAALLTMCCSPRSIASVSPSKPEGHISDSMWALLEFQSVFAWLL